MSVAAVVFSGGLYLDPGQRFVSAQVMPTAIKVCATAGDDATPKYDVVVLVSEPVAQVRLTIVEYSNGHLGVCTY